MSLPEEGIINRGSPFFGGTGIVAEEEFGIVIRE